MFAARRIPIFLSKIQKIIVLVGVVFLVVSFVNVNTARAVIRPVDISWNYNSSAAPNLAGFRIFHQNAYLCETSNPSARQLRCSVDVTTENNRFTMTAFDRAGNQSSRSAARNVVYTLPPSASNAPPTATNANLSTQEDTVLRRFLTASDSNNDPLTYRVVSNPARGTVQLTAGTGEFRYTPNANATGTDSFSFRVNDGTSDSNRATVTITVRPSNDPPRARSGTATTSQGSAVRASLSATDVENNSLTYSIVRNASNGWVQLLNSSTGSYRYTPNANTTGTDSFTFRVSDGSAFSNTATVTITITATTATTPVNNPLVANAGPDQTVNYGDTVTLSGSNSHPVNNIESMQWTQIEGPDVTLSDPTAMQPTFESSEIGADIASLVFELTVTNFNGQTSRDTAIVNVTRANRPPTANAGGNQAVYEGDFVRLNGALSNDPDDGIRSYFWNQIRGPRVTLSNPSARRPTFNAPETGLDGASLVFQLTVSDFDGLQAQDTTIVNVSWVNDPPIANAGQNQAAQSGETVLLDASRSQDNDDGIRSYRWVQTQGFPVTLSRPNSMRPSFSIPPENDSNSPLRFRVTVTDNGGLRSSDWCTVEVQNADQDAAVLSQSSSDINNDGVLNRWDFRLFRRAKGRCVGDRRYKAAADIDGDGCVTRNDFMLFYGDMSR